MARFSYDPYTLDSPTNNVFNCGTGAICTLPADRQIGPVFARLVYLDSNTKVLARSDVTMF